MRLYRLQTPMRIDQKAERALRQLDQLSNELGASEALIERQMRMHAAAKRSACRQVGGRRSAPSSANSEEGGTLSKLNSIEEMSVSNKWDWDTP